MPSTLAPGTFLAAVSIAERGIKGDDIRKKIEVTRKNISPKVNNVLSRASTEKKSDAPDQGALMHRENDMQSEISELDCLQRPLSRDEVHQPHPDPNYAPHTAARLLAVA